VEAIVPMVVEVLMPLEGAIKALAEPAAVYMEETRIAQVFPVQPLKVVKHPQLSPVVVENVAVPLQVEARDGLVVAVFLGTVAPAIGLQAVAVRHGFKFPEVGTPMCLKTPKEALMTVGSTSSSRI
jgi:hypothetical protein